MKKAAIIALLFGLCATAFGQSGNVTIPKELAGTWCRTAAASGRAFDTWITVSGTNITWKYSDNRPNEVTNITGIVALSANDPEMETVAGKAAQFPSGWQISGTEDGQNVNYGFLINPAGNTITQSAGNMQDIWVKQ